jgi:hypothetical protein
MQQDRQRVRKQQLALHLWRFWHRLARQHALLLHQCDGGRELSG